MHKPLNMIRKITVTKKIYNNFIDTGKVPDSIIRLIAFKIIENKELTLEETAIFYGKTSEINEMIKQVKKS